MKIMVNNDDGVGRMMVRRMRNLEEIEKYIGIRKMDDGEKGLVQLIKGWGRGQSKRTVKRKRCGVGSRMIKGEGMRGEDNVCKNELRWWEYMKKVERGWRRVLKGEMWGRRLGWIMVMKLASWRGRDGWLRGGGGGMIRYELRYDKGLID